MRQFILSLMGTCILATTAVPAGASPLSSPQASPSKQAYPTESYAQYYYHHGWGRPYYYHHYNDGAVAAGVAGLAAGALVAGAIASQAQPAAPPPPGTVDPSIAAYCARKYRSYDPATGTFLGRNGMRYVCTYP